MATSATGRTPAAMVPIRAYTTEMPTVGTMMAKGISTVGFFASPEKLMTTWAPPAAKDR